MESKKIDELIEALSRNVKFQSREEMKKKIQKSSNICVIHYHVG